MRESIVLQLGNYSNHVGSHFWNIQSSSAVSGETEDDETERFEGSRLYRRSGEAASGYVPRVLMGDLPENTGHVMIAGESTVATAPKARAAGDAAENSENNLLWDGTTRRIEKEHYPVHPFQTYQQISAQMLMGTIDPTSREHDFFSERVRGGRFEGYERPDERTIKTWCDYMGTPIHSKSYLDLPLQYNNRNFDHFAAAMNHDRTSFASIVDKYLESFRFFAEECDTLTCVQVFADCYDGFSVLAKELVQEIREDYRGVAMPVWAFTDAPLAHTMDGRIWSSSQQRNGSGGAMNNTLRNLSFSYSVASMLDGGASAIVPISGMAAAASVDAAYMHGGSGATALGASESKFSSPLRPGAGAGAGGSQNHLYMSSSVVAAGVDGVLSMDMLRGSSATQRRVDFINGGASGEGDERFHRKSGGVNASSSSGDMWEILYHATNSGRFPCLSLETTIPLSSSPSALMRRVDDRFSKGQGAGAGAPSSHREAEQVLLRSQGRLNPFLSSLSAAQHFANSSLLRKRRARAQGQRPGQGKVLEEEAVSSVFDAPEEEDALEEMYRLADDPDAEDGGSGGTAAAARSALSNVLCVRGSIAREQYGFDKYLWAKASAQEGYDDYGKDLSSRRYFLTRCLQKQSALRTPTSFPAVITASLTHEDSSSSAYSGELCTLSALGADASTTPQFLSAHAALWEAACGSRSGALQSQLHKVGLASEDAKEVAETLRHVASNYKDEGL